MGPASATRLFLFLGLAGCASEPAAPPASGSPPPASPAPAPRAVASGRLVRIVAGPSGRTLAEERTDGDILDLAQKAEGAYLFVAPAGEDLLPYFMGLFDARAGRWAMKLSREESLETPSCIGLSPTGRLAAFEGGTSAGSRDLLIYDLSAANVAFRTSSHPPSQGTPPRWLGGDAFEYYVAVGPTAPGRPKLGAGHSNTYALRMLWKDGVEQATEDYVESYLE